jgi:hypothetical protein
LGRRYQAISKDLTRVMNRLKALYRGWGIACAGTQVYAARSREEWMSKPLQKFDNGLGWETCNHIRNLLSKMFANAKKWGHFGGENPALGVELPEKQARKSKC